MNHGLDILGKNFNFLGYNPDQLISHSCIFFDEDLINVRLTCESIINSSVDYKEIFNPAKLGILIS